MTVCSIIFSSKMRLGKISEWARPGEEIVFKSIRMKPMQIAIINCNKNNNVVVNLPTGFGKSLLFQYPASQLKDKCVIVFVPLKALLWDCLKEAELLNISAQELTSAFIRKYQKDNKLPQLLFLTPQRLFAMGNGVLSFVDMLYFQNMIQFIVIDEAHCISEWGSDFRPDYSKLCELKTMFPNIRLLGMSATIPPEARQDLVSRLKIPGSYYFQSSSNRTNLIYEIKAVQKSAISYELISYLDQKHLKGQSGIIYCQTIKNAEEIFQQLQKLKLDCCLFHSKLAEKKRSQNFDKFMNEEIKIVVATICFGMGVNKKNIRFVINIGVSLSAQNYYQESGRAGRDGEISYCLLLTFKSDVNPLEYLITSSTKKEILKRRRIHKLYQLKNYTKTQQCRKKHLFALLGEEFTPEQCKKTCDFCREGLVTEYTEIDYTEPAMRIMAELANIKVKLTKIQLANLLKGKEANLNDKLLKEKVKILIGMLKEEKTQRIENLIDTLIQERMLVRSYHFTKGKFKRKIQYLLPCSKVQIKKKDSIKLKVIKSKLKDIGLDAKKQPQFEKASSFVAKKFEKYLTKKTKTEGTLSFDQKIQEKQQAKTEQKNIFSESSKNANKFDQRDDDELKEIKIIPMSVDYQHFFDDLFGKQLEEQICEQKEDENEEKIEEKQQELRKSEYETYEEEELEHAISEPPRKQVQNQQTIQNSDEDSFDLEFIERIRKKKAELNEKKKENKPIVRSKLSNIDFL